MKAQLLMLSLITLFVLEGQVLLWSQSGQKQAQIVRPSSVSGEPAATLVNINNISMWIRADGLSARDPVGNSGVTFPRQTAQVIFQDGIVWGGLVNDGSTPLIRVGGQTYGVGTVAGAILAPGVAEDPNATDVRIWRIRTDYASADLTLDAQELGLDVETVRSQYETDWREWPWEKGAPWVGIDNFRDGGYLDADGVTVVGVGNGMLDRGEDSNRNGILDAGEDANGNGILDGEFPGIVGADQVVWTVANDLDQTTVQSLYGSPSIGIEMQLTLWAYDTEGPLGNVIFKRYRLIYKGADTTPQNAVIDSMYVCQWSDPDLGDFNDDLVGSDTTLSLGYIYNGLAVDNQYAPFGLVPPAAGYRLLQGPIVPSAGDTAFFDFGERAGFRNLPMSTFAFFRSGGPDSDPIMGGNYNGTVQWWNLLRGFKPRPEFPPQPWIDPTTSLETAFLVPGDPIAGTGWIDDIPADRRLLLASGPFQMAIGDTQEVLVALLAGLGPSHLLSIDELKQTSRSAQILFENKFVHVLASVDVSAEYESASVTRVFVSATIVQAATGVEVTLTDATGAIMIPVTLFDDGAHSDGAAGDGVFANELTVTPHLTPLYVNVTVTTATGTFEFTKTATATTVGPLEIAGLLISSDNINSDGVINPGENVRVTASLRNGSAFDFSSITATFGFSGPIDAGSEVAQRFSGLDAGETVAVTYDPADANTYANFQVSQSAQAGDTITVAVTLFDTLGNKWQDSTVLTVTAFVFEPEMRLAAHVAGPGRGTFGIDLVDPQALTGDKYGITINDPTGLFEDRTLNLVDVTRGDTLLFEHALPDEFGHNMPVTHGFKLTRGTLVFESGFDQFVEVAFAGQAVEPPDNIWHSLNSNRSYYLSAGGGTGGLDRLSRSGRNFANLRGRDLELRFTDSGSRGAWFFESTTTGIVPFELWDIGRGTPDDPADDARLIPILLTSGSANGTVGVFDVEANSFDSAFGFPITDWIYFWSGDYQAFETDAMDGNFDDDSVLELEYLARLVFADFDQDGQIPPTGTTIRITTFKPPSQLDVYEFFTVITDIAQDQGSEIPRSFSLSQNYPNPFNPETTIAYSVPRVSRVKLEVFNILGQRVKTLVDKRQEPGKYVVVWDGTNEARQKVSSGLFIYRLSAKGFVESRKLLLLR